MIYLNVWAHIEFTFSEWFPNVTLCVYNLLQVGFLGALQEPRGRKVRELILFIGLIPDVFTHQFLFKLTSVVWEIPKGSRNSQSCDATLSLNK